jgi:hypothetical protein
MPTTASFDITSTIDFQEVDNALNQARKEVGQRYDFKGAKADIDLNAAEKTLTLTTDDEMKMNALWRSSRPGSFGAASPSRTSRRRSLSRRPAARSVA